MSQTDSEEWGEAPSSHRKAHSEEDKTSFSAVLLSHSLTVVTQQGVFLLFSLMSQDTINLPTSSQPHPTVTHQAP